jgi:hypothetical protein
MQSAPANGYLRSRFPPVSRAGSKTRQLFCRSMPSQRPPPPPGAVALPFRRNGDCATTLNPNTRTHPRVGPTVEDRAEAPAFTLDPSCNGRGKRRRNDDEDPPHRVARLCPARSATASQPESRVEERGPLEWSLSVGPASRNGFSKYLTLAARAKPKGHSPAGIPGAVDHLGARRPSEDRDRREKWGEAARSFRTGSHAKSATGDGTGTPSDRRPVHESPRRSPWRR